MFKSSFFILVLILSLTSCSEKNSVLKNFKNYENPKAIQFTKKRDVLLNGVLKGSFFVTYLNKIDSSFEDENYENFLVGVFLNSEEDKNFISENYSLLLENNRFEKITEIPNDSNIVKSISLKNSWAKYYLIKYKAVEKNRLNLTIENPKFENVNLSFRKSN